jgi:hypothetical protein
MRTVCDFVIDRLIEWDLHRFYGYPVMGSAAINGAGARGAGQDVRYSVPSMRRWRASLPVHAKFTRRGGRVACLFTGASEPNRISSSGRGRPERFKLCCGYKP